jgi:succinate dehydrogenase/fumarate reductase flavoprotein subunit
MNDIQASDVDVLVVGGGMAGLCAALTAAERGASVLVIEKGTRFGGSMFLSNGIVWSYSRASDARRLVPDGDHGLQDLLVAQLDGGLQWLEDRGVALEPRRVYLGCGHGRAASGPQMTQALVAAIRERGGRVASGASLAQLTVRAGEVTGALVLGAHGPVEVQARPVVLATGGFQGNAELLARHVSPHADAMYLRANPWSTGDGLLAALAVGAATTARLNTFYGHALTAPPARFDAFGFQEMSHKYAPMALALNLHGRRFADESAGTGEEWLNAHIARQPQATAAYVFDALVGEREYEGGALARVVFERARAAGGPVAQADSLEELATALHAWGFPPDEVLRSLREFNAAVRAGTADRLAPARRANVFEVKQPPFRAALVRSAITFTCGGLAVDLDMRVLRRAATVSTLPLVTAPAHELCVGAIGGLYAAGCDVGGFSTNAYLGGLAQALVSGRIAGTTATAG